jgi:hypothetical protein
MPQDEKPQDNAELKTPKFAAIFAADLEPEVVTCEVGDGLECKFWLQAMDSGDLQRFFSMGVKVTMGSDGAETRQADLAMDERTMFLVSRTLTDWLFWTRPQLKDGGRGDWQQAAPPAEPKHRRRFVEDNFRCVPAFWNWLATECLRVNGMLGDTPKN